MEKWWKLLAASLNAIYHQNSMILEFINLSKEKYSLINICNNLFLLYCHLNKERTLLYHHMNKSSLFVSHKQEKVVFVFFLASTAATFSNKITLKKEENTLLF